MVKAGDEIDSIWSRLCDCKARMGGSGKLRAMRSFVLCGDKVPECMRGHGPLQLLVLIRTIRAARVFLDDE